MKKLVVLFFLAVAAVEAFPHRKVQSKPVQVIIDKKQADSALFSQWLKYDSCLDSLSMRKWQRSLNFLADPGNHVIPSEEDMVYLQEGVFYVNYKKEYGVLPTHFYQGRRLDRDHKMRLIELAVLALTLRGEINNYSHVAFIP